MTLREAKERVGKEGNVFAKPWLCTYEVMAYCSMSEGALKAARRERMFPRPKKQGLRKNLYSRMEIDEWVQDCELMAELNSESR